MLSFTLNLFPQSNNPLFQTPIFENISIEDGLPENSVTCILQDYLGYLWLGTQNGLVRYDGYSMKVFQPEDMNQEKLRQKGIVILYEDTEKTLWIGTLNGLYKFNRSDETFKCYKNLDNDVESINSDLVHSIYEDKKGRLWIGTHQGLNLFDRIKEKFTRYYFDLKETEVIITPTPNHYNLGVNAITEDPTTGELLIGTGLEGLWKFNYTQNTFTKYKIESIHVDRKIGYIQSFNTFEDNKIWMASYHTLCSLNPETGEFNSYIEFPVKEEERHWRPNFVNASILEDYNGLIWCAFNAGGKGIFCLDIKSKHFLNYKPVTEEQNKGYTNKIHMIYMDHSDILWVGTWGTGLWKWDRRKKKFLPANNSLNNFEAMSNFSVSSFIYDPTGFIWFSTSHGLEKYDLKSGMSYHYIQNESCLSQNNVYSTFIDKSGNIWLGTSSCGLIRFNPDDESYRYYFNDTNNPTNLGNKLITNIYQDHLGSLWIATDGYGLFRYDTVKNKLTQFKHDSNDPFSLTQNQPRAIYEDKNGNMWIGTNLGGLDEFNIDTEKFTHHGFNCVLAIHKDKANNFWIGDYFTGLNLFDRQGDSVVACYTREDGLTSYSMWGIIEDDSGNLWIKTDNGLFKFDILTKKFRRYTQEDGLLTNFFSPFGQDKSSDGIIYFNTNKGIFAFNPDSIKDDPSPPQVVISNISLFNRPEEKLNIDGFISEVKEITLPYNQNDLRFDYVGLQYSEPLKNTYKYILENFDEDWVEAETQRNATYTNLNPGEYVFKVKAANRDGVWSNNEASLKIIITPPWWKTNLAYLFFALVLISIVYLTWRLQLKRIRIKNEYKMSKFEAEKLQEVDELKSRFFTNISHEFRTPLTLILGPVKQMMEKLDSGKMKDDLTVVHRNANKLLELVNQLLDVSKIESGNMKLQVSAQNIIQLVKALVLSFSSYAERKGITLKFISFENEIITYIDNSKIEKIITNILSNAFKFTPEGGLIDVNVLKDKEYVNVSVRDTGIGIPKEKVQNIFNRFYQVDRSHKREQEGSGIGLALAKELIELHKGKITVESEEGRGTNFTISIPLGKDHLKPEEICVKTAEKDKEYEKEQIIIEADGDVKKTNRNKIVNELFKRESLPLLLIVEDNPDVRDYIIDNLNENYKILEAADGKTPETIKQIQGD